MSLGCLPAYDFPVTLQSCRYYTDFTCNRIQTVEGINFANKMNNARTTMNLIPKRCTDGNINTPRSPCNPCFNVECGNGSLRLRNLFLGNDVPRTYFASSIPNIETRGCKGDLTKGLDADTYASCLFAKFIPSPVSMVSLNWSL